MTTKAEETRLFDVTVLGATGFVGHRLVSELDKLSRELSFRLMATVRTAEKAAVVRREFPKVHVAVLDVFNPGAVRDVVKNTRLVVNCVGPFDRYAENVVRACAETGTHYLDITGEVLFVRRMIERYDEVARENGSMIVPCAGFDSVPSDISVLLVALEMHQTREQEVASVDVIYRARGGLNGGTAASAVDMASKLRTEDVENLNFLVPGAAEVEHADLNRPRYIEPLKKWVAPFFMEPINNKVVYRSLALRRASGAPAVFAADFKYRESVFVPGGAVGAWGISATLKATDLLLKTRVGRRVASKLMPKPGEGPSEQSMREGFFNATAVAHGAQGAVLIRKMTAQGDPANVATVKILCACVRTVLDPAFSPRAGLLTPAAAFGEKLLPALRASGVEWK